MTANRLELARDLDRDFNSVAAASAEERPVKRTRHELRQLPCQLNSGHGRLPEGVRYVAQLSELVGNGFGDLRPSMSDGLDEAAGVPINKSVAVDVVDVTTVTVGHDVVVIIVLQIR